MQYPTFEICEFTEEDFISAIERELQKYFFSENLVISRISQSDEKSLGYDGVIDHIVPIYIQFKRSNFYRDTYQGQLAEDRLSILKKNQNSFFAFNLHKDSKTKKYLQHNLLFKLRDNNFHSCYVAPLFFKKTQLHKLKTSKAHKYKFYPWYLERLTLRDRNVLTEYKVRLFKDSISIVPHKEVKDSSSRHTYSFNKDKEVCFHSQPEFIEGKAKSLNDFIVEILSNLRNIAELELNVKQIIDRLIGILDVQSNLDTFNSYAFYYTDNQYSNSEEKGSLFNSLPYYFKLRVIEDYLDKEFGISQLILHIRKS